MRRGFVRDRACDGRRRTILPTAGLQRACDTFNDARVRRSGRTYEILSALGAGGMGEVYRALDPRLGRDIAIKVLPAEFSTDPIAFIVSSRKPVPQQP